MEADFIISVIFLPKKNPMSQQLFPPEIIENTTEAHFHSNNRSFHWIYLSLLILVLTGIAILPVISVDVTSQSRGVIRTKNENTLIIPAFYGRVTKTFLEEGRHIQYGDTLVILESDRLDAQLENSMKLFETNLLFLEDLKCLSRDQPQQLKTPKYKNEWNKYTAGIREFDIKLKLLQEDFNQQKYLYSEKVIAEIDFLKSENNLETVKSQLELFKQEMKNNWQFEISRLELENEDIRSSIKQLRDEKSQYVITAPASGSLLEVIGVQTGSFVSPGQKLAEISLDEALIAECYVNSSDIGYLRSGQKVRFQFDAFNYNQWGLLEGKVSKISEDVIVVENQPVFKVRCELPSTYLQLKTGHKGVLKKGMTLTGRFVMTRRTLFQLLFDKVDDWLNPKII
jgi:multidrug resistance efflux pump